jgi:hypothetical protein
MLAWLNVRRTWWPRHSLEISKMLLEPVLNNLGTGTRCIVLLEYPIFVGVHEVYEGLQMITKQCHVAITGQ